jgi:hypothetical protein
VESLDLFKFLNININEKDLYNTLSAIDLLKIAVSHQPPTMDLLSSLVENLNNNRNCVLVLMSFDAELVCQYMCQHVHDRKELDSFKYYPRIAHAIFTMITLEDDIPLRIPYDKLISLISVILVFASFADLDIAIPCNIKMSSFMKMYRFTDIYQMNQRVLASFMYDAGWISNLLKSQK